MILLNRLEPDYTRAIDQLKGYIKPNLSPDWEFIESVQFLIRLIKCCEGCENPTIFFLFKALAKADLNYSWVGGSHVIRFHKIGNGVTNVSDRADNAS